MIVDLIAKLNSIELGLSFNEDNFSVFWFGNGDILTIPLFEISKDIELKKEILNFANFELEEEHYSEIRYKLNELINIL